MSRDIAKLLYLNSSQVKGICEKLDSIKIIKEVFSLKALGKTVLPNEAYLSWMNAKNENARSINMPSYLGDCYNIAGTKIINANISNTKRGLARANGLTLLFDADTAMINCIMEGAYISSLRTASVSALGIDLLRIKSPIKLAIIGLGIQGTMHLRFLMDHIHDINVAYIYDQDISKSKKIYRDFKNLQKKIIIAKDAKEAIANSSVVVTTTTTNEGYIKADWIQNGTLIVHVSLDDLLPEAIEKADKLIVDDWNLVKNDTKRIFGRMYRDGLLSGPDIREKNKPYIYANFADIITKKKCGRKSEEEIIIFNPFGLAIEDIGIAYHVYKIAQKNHVGKRLMR